MVIAIRLGSGWEYKIGHFILRSREGSFGSGGGIFFVSSLGLLALWRLRRRDRIVLVELYLDRQIYRTEARVVFRDDG